MILALLNQGNRHPFSRNDHWLHRVRQLIDVQYRHTLDDRDLIQIKIVGNNLALHNLSKLQQLDIYLRNFLQGLLGIRIVDFNPVLGLNFVENIQTPAPAVTLQCV